ncbi:MAG: hypothetical protein HYV13_03030 [Candidatus Doudnabacteria bacterium]|nr:hypothetical protein [Candidatus Doudnabacteria bacterium]
MANKSREVLTHTGEPEAPDKIQAIENEVLTDAEKRSPEFLAYLGKVDFDLLRKLFFEIFKRIGMDETSFNFLGPERIVESNHGTTYSGIDNAIIIALKNLEATGRPTEQDFAHVLIHEEVHATAKTICRGEIDPTWLADYFPNKVNSIPENQFRELRYGLSRLTLPKKSIHGRTRVFYLLNEGVTEKLAREIFEKYANVKDMDVKEHGKKVNDEKNPENYYYPIPVRFVEALVDRIAKETGLESKMVWESFVRAAYTGEDMENPELRQAFAETISDDFLSRLSRLEIGDEEQMLELIEELKKNN